MIDAVRYVVDNGVKWANPPRGFPPLRRVHAGPDGHDRGFAVGARGIEHPALVVGLGRREEDGGPQAPRSAAALTMVFKLVKSA